MRGLVSVRNSRLVWVLACGLAVSLLGNLISVWMFMESQTSYGKLVEAYDELHQSYEELKGTYLPKLPKPPISKDPACLLCSDPQRGTKSSRASLALARSIDFVPSHSQREDAGYCHAQEDGHSYEYGIKHRSGSITPGTSNNGRCDECNVEKTWYER